MENAGDLDCTYNYYYKGQSVIETRDGSDQVLKQYVWGNDAGGYVDELCQVAVNSDPATSSTCDTTYYAMQGPNYNVWGLVDDAGALVERYTYRPYGQRQVYTSSGTNDPDCYTPIPMSQRVEISGVAQPYGLCTYNYYYKGQSVIETRDGSDQVLKQYVWGNDAGGYQATLLCLPRSMARIN